MQIEEEIVVLKRRDINDDKWNECVENAGNGLIYTYTWFLDSFAENWLGIVYGDYKIVMALPVRKKIHLQYVFMPVLLAQLGLFGNNINDVIVADFINAVPRSIKLIDYNINNNNELTLNNATITKQPNYILSLDQSHEQLQKNYKTNTIRNIDKSKKYGSVISLKNENSVIDLALKQFAGYSKNILNGLKNYKELNKKCPLNNRCKNYGYVNPGGEIIAAASVMFSNNRIYYLVAANTAEGKKKGAAHVIVDTIIRDFCAQGSVLDFEGSSISGIANFYAGFGAVATTFQHLHVNKLNIVLKKILGKT